MIQAHAIKLLTDKANVGIESQNEQLYADYIKATEQAITTAAGAGLYVLLLDTTGQTSDAVAFMIVYLRRAGFRVYNDATAPVINWEQG